MNEDQQERLEKWLEGEVNLPSSTLRALIQAQSVELDSARGQFEELCEAVCAVVDDAEALEVLGQLVSAGDALPFVAANDGTGYVAQGAG